MVFSWELPDLFFNTIALIVFVLFVIVSILFSLAVLIDIVQSLKNKPISTVLRLSLFSAAIGLVIWFFLPPGDNLNEEIIKKRNRGVDIKISDILKISATNTNDIYVMALTSYASFKCAPLGITSLRQLGIDRYRMMINEHDTYILVFNGKQLLNSGHARSELICRQSYPLQCTKLAETILIFDKVKNCYKYKLQN